MPDVVLTLGDVTFTGFELPESMPFGGAQALAVHRLVGGTRIIDAMGADAAPLEWSGLFLGANAVERARSVDQWRKDGQSATLTWADFRYEVLVRFFQANYDAPFRVPYRIVCEVLEDQSEEYAGQDSIDDAINGDLTAAGDLTDSIGDGTLSGLMGTLQTATASVSNFAKATQGTIASVLQPLNAVRSQAQILIASTENTLRNVTTLGGILPNNPLASNVASLTSQVNAHLTATQLYSLDSLLGRTATNLGQVNSSVKTTTVSGGNLFDLASKYYGTASGWTSIAKANGLTDPEITGITTLVIPNNSSDAGGVLAS